MEESRQRREKCQIVRTDPCYFRHSESCYVRLLNWRLDTPALHAYCAGTMEKKPVQYTIRNVPERTNQLLRAAAVEHGKSLNETAVTALQRGLGADAEVVEHHDLDELIGSWVRDDACDKALDEMDRIDPELWS